VGNYAQEISKHAALGRHQELDDLALVAHVVAVLEHHHHYRTARFFSELEVFPSVT
jgi:hypothetical protein